MFPSRAGYLPPRESLEWLHGSIADVNQYEYSLCLLIQPNCPGCHIHALAIANELYIHSLTQLKDERSYDIYCVSTAFEDFEWNTKESTQTLLNGFLVGVAKQKLGNTTKEVPLMPTAQDVVVSKAEAPADFVQLAVETTKQHAMDQMARGLHPPGVLKQMLEPLGKEILPNQLASYFYAVGANGTPTWVVHENSTGRVLDQMFGQVKLEKLQAWISDTIEKQVGLR